MKKRIFRIYLILLVLGSFFLANYNAFFNGHYHKLFNGSIIFHAHPHEKLNQDNPAFPAHTHSSIQLFGYSELLISLAFTLIYLIVISYFNDALTEIHKIIKKSWHQIFFIIRYYFRRGPPVYSHIQLFF